MFHFSYCHYQSSQSTADLLVVVSNRIARAFNRSGATQAVALDIALQDFWQGLAGLHKPKSWNLRSIIWPYFLFSQ